MRRLTLGSYPTLSLADARQLAKGALREAQLGLDPAGSKQTARAAETFGELAVLYLERHAKVTKRSWREDERILDHDLLPRWKSRKATEIKRGDMITLLDEIVERGAPVMANRTRALLSKVFNFGIRRGVVEANPAHGIDNPGQERRRDRVLSETEFRAVWTALDSLPKRTAAIFRLALLTAQRKGEIVGMQWSEIDFVSCVWTVPAERSKNGLPHRVPLTPSSIRILRELEAESRRDPVLVFRGGRIGCPLSNLQKPLRRLKRISDVDFRIQDLRRTAASLMTGVGISRLVVSKILNHVERGITAVYDRHGYDGEKRAALLKWDRRLAEIVSGQSPEKVIAIQSRPSK